MIFFKEISIHKYNNKRFL